MPIYVCMYKVKDMKLVLLMIIIIGNFETLHDGLTEDRYNHHCYELTKIWSPVGPVDWPDITKS